MIIELAMYLERIKLRVTSNSLRQMKRVILRKKFQMRGVKEVKELQLEEQEEAVEEEKEYLMMNLMLKLMRIVKRMMMTRRWMEARNGMTLAMYATKVETSYAVIHVLMFAI